MRKDFLGCPLIKDRYLTIGNPAKMEGIQFRAQHISCYYFGMIAQNWKNIKIQVTFCPKNAIFTITT